jgi:hypothetical protein
MILEFWHFETLIIELRIWGLIDDDSVECRGVFIVLFSGVSTVAVLFHSCLACVSIGWRSGDRKLLLVCSWMELWEGGVVMLSEILWDFWVVSAEGNLWRLREMHVKLNAMLLCWMENRGFCKYVLLLFLGVEEKREWGVLFSDFWSEKQWMSEA